MKKSPSKIAIATTAALMALGLTAPKAEAAGGERLINHAHALQNTVAQLNVELPAHYSRTRAFRHMLSYTNLLNAKAAHIDLLAHSPHTSLIHLRTDIIEIDKYEHQLHALIDAADQGRYGHVNGNTHRIHNLMAYMERLVHSMEAEVTNIQRLQQMQRPSPLGFGQGFGQQFGQGLGQQFGQVFNPNCNGNNVHPNVRPHVQHSRTASRNINDYVGHQYRNPQSQVPRQQLHQQQRIRIDPRGLFNLFRLR